MMEKELIRIMDHNFAIIDKFINESKANIHTFRVSLEELQNAITKNKKYCKKLNYFLYGSLVIGVIAFARGTTSKKQIAELKERIEQLENKKGA